MRQGGIAVKLGGQAGRSSWAVKPASVNYLYFVAMDERRHQFSTTLAEHNAAVAKYRLARTR